MRVEEDFDSHNRPLGEVYKGTDANGVSYIIMNKNYGHENGYGVFIRTAQGGFQRVTQWYERFRYAQRVLKTYLED